jgi:RHS repeat-associated protein
VLGLPQEQYSYDQVGNRPVSGHQPGTWAYNSDNQMTQYPRLVPFSGGASPVDTSVSYTAQGHTQKETSSQGERSYTYNAAERLIQYSSTAQGQPSPSLEAGYRYDPFGRRISKSVNEGASTQTTYFVYSDSGLMAEANEQGQISKAYGFNPKAAQQGLWSTDPIWQANANNGSLTATDASYHYLHTDHLGTPMLATSKTGASTWKAVQEAFGAAGTLPESSITMNLRFPGQYFDSESQTHYNFNRDYKPNTGRYVQGDPIGLEGGLNIYLYANQSPVFNIDVDGRKIIWTGSMWGGSAIGGAGAAFYRYALTSECKCGKQISIKGSVSSVAGGVGFTYTLSGGAASFYDYKDCPDPGAANGGFGMIAVSSVGGIGKSCAKITLGHLFSDFSCSNAKGVDLSAWVYIGASLVTNVEIKDCCEK